ncbi:hypothetical protein ND861_07375 [Leptospira sp. 2 VSF19]|uniref:Uncharacterized protein n=1 Tax=Leptospira soteropolitanensis TaxID=2950025 RepID=A0AAW5VDP6_9LEPT|nr:hypothetical protein [Leptospira soteropolitanensis]MCW7492815.1 hypothetical protein [Leptospira soteropolitanensis]MCW7500050.1 hypothetical protein [Leptospira soteropolitanensis]MCW7522301.1 hypothetical protein [Leptospira soteropolitanensis]MCW7526157.1 hypothetical protein [Leptospira soteropolitanensis]MCW7529731.1 hypothetical protein [Leptospira soteropolitanensis]
MEIFNITVQSNILLFVFLGILWILNDSVLKILFPGLVTGKISDVIGLLLTPLILTGIISLFRKKENLYRVFSVSLFFTILLFLFINLSQSINDSFYKFINSNEKMNLADRSDLLLLPFSFFTVYFFKKTKPFFKIPNLRKLPILLFPTLALINTSYPTGRSDLISIIGLLSLATDTIIQLDLKEITVADNNYTFQFQFIGMNNESSARISEIPDPNSHCSNPEKPTIDFGNRENKDIEVGKFQNYIIEISKSQNFETIVKTSDCNNTACIIDLQSLGSGKFFWKVRVRYLYRRECQLYLENFSVPQEVHYFMK